MRGFYGLENSFPSTPVPLPSLTVNIINNIHLAVDFDFCRHDVIHMPQEKAINRLRGISNNKILNLLIADYVLQYEKLLKEN